MEQIKVGSTVYGLFRNGQQAYLRAGEVTSTESGLFTVDFTRFHWSYAEKDIGRSVFTSEDAADAALEDFHRNVRMGFYE